MNYRRATRGGCIFCQILSFLGKGANEYTNGLIKQYFPKGSSFEEITPDKVKWVQDKLNNRPRKRLNYLTPNEIYNIIINNQKVALAA